MRLFLTHTDTLYRMEREGLPFSAQALQVNQENLSLYDEVATVFAFWSPRRLDDEAAWDTYLSAIENGKRKIGDAPVRGLTPLYAIEDARLLCGKQERLYRLKEDGISMIAPVWGGENLMGGAYDTNTGLTPIGRCLMREALELGIYADISHGSTETAAELIKLSEACGMPIMASHANARAVCAHPRNLTDREIRAVCESGGLIGLCFYPEHVGGTRDVSALLEHIEHMLTLGAERHLCIGSDFDGMETSVAGIPDAGHVSALMEAVTERYGASFADALFYENAARVLL